MAGSRSILILTLSSLLPATVNGAGKPSAKITVRVYNYINLADNILASAATQASKLLREAGIASEWR